MAVTAAIEVSVVVVVVIANHLPYLAFVDYWSITNVCPKATGYSMKPYRRG